MYMPHEDQMPIYQPLHGCKSASMLNGGADDVGPLCWRLGNPVGAHFLPSLLAILRKRGRDSLA